MVRGALGFIPAGNNSGLLTCVDASTLQMKGITK